MILSPLYIFCVINVINKCDFQKILHYVQINHFFKSKNYTYHIIYHKCIQFYNLSIRFLVRSIHEFSRNPMSKFVCVDVFFLWIIQFRNMLVENYGLLSDIVPYSPIKLEFKCKWAGFIPWYNMRICILYHSLRFVSNVKYLISDTKIIYYLMFYLLYLCLFPYNGIRQHMLCYVFLPLVYPMLPVSLECQFLIIV